MSAPARRAARAAPRTAGLDACTTWTDAPVARAAAVARSTAVSSAASGREPSHARASPRASESRVSSSQCSATSTPALRAAASAGSSSSGVRCGNSSTPLGQRNAFTPTTPHSASSRSASASVRTSPPQSAKSTIALADAASYLASNAAASIVGGIELSGMSAMVVTPPAAAPRVAATQPSHSVRPGSFTCTCPSTTPGSTTSPRASISCRASPSPCGVRRVMTPSSTWMSASTIPSLVTTRPPRIARSGKLDRKVLCAFPERETPDLREVLRSLDHRREMIAGELTDLAREQRRAIREHDLHLRDAAGIHEDLTGRGMAGVVLEVDADPRVAHRDPRRLAAPAHVDEPALEGKYLADRGTGLRRELFLEPRGEHVACRADAKRLHRGRTIPRRWRRGRSRPTCSTRPPVSPPAAYAYA